MTIDYKDTIFLPKTDFPMNRVADEAAILGGMANHYAFMSANNTGTPKFVLHDGPPYANGNLHMGHALNKIIKDMVVRSKYGLGFSVDYTPGWDCHGLPIEWKVERELMEAGDSKSNYTVMQFREMCRAEALKWVDIQREQFKKLGVQANWDNPYLSTNTEAVIADELLKIAESGKLYRDLKPVLWSPIEKTALAEAEVDHKELNTKQIWVGFPVKSGYVNLPTDMRPNSVSVLIWTTTPWTIPSNKAVAFNPKIEYGLYKRPDHTGGVIVAKFYAPDSWTLLGDVNPAQLELYHPLRGQAERYDITVPVLEADFVEEGVGTGLVHIAPEHGPDDFAVWKKYFPHDRLGMTVGSEGEWQFDLGFPFGGVKVVEEYVKEKKGKKEYTYSFNAANQVVIDVLRGNGRLFGVEPIKLSYPHSWRSGSPLIYRATKQWFMKLDGVRQQALDSLKKVTFVPDQRQARLENAVSGRPDWLLSRQRVWGTPMCLFTNKGSGELLINSVVNDNIRRVLAQDPDAWWTTLIPEFFEGSGLNHYDYEKCNDVLDVWFDSACSLNQAGLDAPADLYIEGSDQHRGWFGSSLLKTIASDGVAPFETLITHGFVLDGKGEKMSKSKGNVIDPQTIIDQYGTDTLRLWVAMSDWTQDVRASDESFKTAHDAYRKLRNTLKYLIGATKDFNPFAISGGPLGNHSVLHDLMYKEMQMVQHKAQHAYDEYRFKDVVKLIMDFCTNDLSSFYFDVFKDTLYCDPLESAERRHYLSTLSAIYMMLSNMLMPIIPFTCEEGADHSQKGRWITTSRWYVSENYGWDRRRLDAIKDVVRRVNLALEEARNNKLIGSSAEAHVIVQVTPYEEELLNDERPSAAMIFRTSQATLEVVYTSPSVLQVTVEKAKGKKCARSWLYNEGVGNDSEYPDISERDAVAVREWVKRNVSA
jgi:isoleucyl-tRNA synthetase